LLFNPGPAIEAASLIIKKTVPFCRSFIRGVSSENARTGLKPETYAQRRLHHAQNCPKKEHVLTPLGQDMIPVFGPVVTASPQANYHISGF
jgi:hypothetical protein